MKQTLSQLANLPDRIKHYQKDAGYEKHGLTAADVYAATRGDHLPDETVHRLNLWLGDQMSEWVVYTDHEAKGPMRVAAWYDADFVYDAYFTLKSGEELPPLPAPHMPWRYEVVDLADGRTVEGSYVEYEDWFKFLWEAGGLLGTAKTLRNTSPVKSPPKDIEVGLLTMKYDLACSLATYFENYPGAEQFEDGSPKFYLDDNQEANRNAFVAWMMAKTTREVVYEYLSYCGIDPNDP